MDENSNQTSRRVVDAEENEMNEEEIDINLEETFPASDPPSWTLGTDHLGRPLKQRSQDCPEDTPHEPTRDK
jgi:hypothetical protein